MHEKNEEIIINNFMQTYSTTQIKQGIYMKNASCQNRRKMKQKI